MWLVDASYCGNMARGIDRLSGSLGMSWQHVSSSVRGTTNSELERTRGIRLFN
jgi:hypothetical protein